ARLFRVGRNERLIAIVVHHLVCDGRSLQILLEELGELYRGGKGMAPQHWQYRDYALQEMQHPDEQGLLLWLETLGDSTAPWLPYDGSNNSGTAGRVRGRLPVTTGELEALSQRGGVTLHMSLLGALQLLLYRYGGDAD